MEIEDCSKENDYRHHDDDRPYGTVYDDNAVGVEHAPYLVDEARQSEPPGNGSGKDAQEAHDHLDGVVGQDESELGKDGKKEEDDEWIEKRHPESRNAVIQERAFLLTAYVHVLCRVGAETVNAEQQQHHAAHNLKEVNVLRLIYQVDHHTHSQSGQQGIDDVAACCPDTGDEAIPASLVKRTLDTQDADRSHGSRGNHANQHTLYNNIYNVNVCGKRHSECKGSANRRQCKEKSTFSFIVEAQPTFKMRSRLKV